MRVAYLGPAGTYSHEALLGSAGALAGPGPLEALPLGTIHEVVMAVERREVDRGVVPIENSVEGSVNATLDALAFEAPRVQIVGETVLAIHHCLIGRPGIAIEQVRLVISHPQALAQCAGFVRTRLPRATVRAAASTAEAVRAVAAGAAGEEGWAALGPQTAAERYGAAVLVENVEDVAGNETRFAWLARSDGAGADGGGAADAQGAADAGDAADAGGAGHETQAGPSLDAQRASFKTAVAFWPQESDHPGWLVDCLAEFSGRGVNMTRIESRPRKVGLGEYVFFVDVQGAASDPEVTAALEGIETHVAQLRVLGSFPAA